jgi:hypothetical protein
MSSILLGLTLIGVAWLSIWSVKDHERPSKTWWPFAMREPVQRKPNDSLGPNASTRSARGTGKPMQRPWRRSGF